ncbi:MAG: hypothetical protein WDW36_005732 [Sanguina aurantia]
MPASLDKHCVVLPRQALHGLTARCGWTCDEKGFIAICAFGIPGHTHEDNPSRGILAALDLQKRVEADGHRVAIGVTTGDLLCTCVGARKIRCEYTVFGDAINLSARLMCKSKQGMATILCDEPTHALSKYKADFEELQPLQVKGKAATVVVYKVSPFSASGARIPTQDKEGEEQARGNTRQLVGRDTEMAMVLNKAANMISGLDTGGVIVIEGNTGMGKTKLLCAVRASLDAIVVWREAQARDPAAAADSGVGVGVSDKRHNTAPPAAPTAAVTAPQDMFRSVLNSHCFPVTAGPLAVALAKAAAATAAAAVQASAVAPPAQQALDPGSAAPAANLDPHTQQGVPSQLLPGQAPPVHTSEEQAVSSHPPGEAGVTETVGPALSARLAPSAGADAAGGGKSGGGGGGSASRRRSVGENHGARERPVFHLFSGVADIANKSQKLHPWRRIFHDLFLADAAMCAQHGPVAPPDAHPSLLKTHSSSSNCHQAPSLSFVRPTASRRRSTAPYSPHQQAHTHGPITPLGELLAAQVPGYSSEWRTHLSELLDIPISLIPNGTPPCGAAAAAAAVSERASECAPGPSPRMTGQQCCTCAM